MTDQPPETPPEIASEDQPWETWSPRRGPVFKVLVWVFLTLIALGLAAMVLMVL